MLYAVSEPQPGWRIQSFDAMSHVARTYIDTNHNDDIRDEGGLSPVRSWRFVGDTDGDEAGTRTQVEVTFRIIRVQIRRCQGG